LRCQCCKKVFSSRKGTPLYYLKTKPERVEMVLWFLVEGVDIAVMVRYTGHKYASQRMVWGSRKALGDRLEAKGFSRSIQASYIEPLNLTFRHCVAGLARQTLVAGIRTATAAPRRVVPVVLSSRASARFLARTCAGVERQIRARTPRPWPPD
jgi:hypothetical protein